MATYLVTGGAGFIGSHIVRELVNRKQSVVVLDNLVTGKLKNLQPVKDKIHFIKGDIRALSDVKKACRQVDYVLHQAALLAAGLSVDNPLETNDINITGTLNVLVAARDAHVKRVVFASSAAVYGDVKTARNTETLPPRPQSPYALTKLVGEHYCKLFTELYGLETVALRYFNVFGPNQDPESKYSSIVPIFVTNLLRGVQSEIHWHGRQSRDFTYVRNVAIANLKVATSPRVKAGQAYNIGNGKNISINTLYQQLQKLLGTAIKPKYTSKRAGDILRSRADIKRATRDFGYKPEISFADGLAESIAWYKSQQ